ncbi:MFS transporter [Arthrobacter sp. Marseille-P9274]|uniref:MFS transporter n=1 Tax=Arthrobacter sp. Marseille-P9274 TaxID=2866572 RepID=UPI0021C5D845|nr:MFS transporter [Arthrobacter sp. Marseille-P9274]
MTVLSELMMRPADVRAERGWDAGQRTRLALTISTMALLLVGANLATPLYPLLQERLTLGPFAVTLTFSSYVLALVVGLLLYGHWSDHIGRRAALVLSVVIGLLGGMVFATAGGLGGLVAGRILQGAAVAMATGATSAALRELLPNRPEWASRFTLLASTGGVAAGPVLGGLLSQLPHPTLMPFVAHSACLAVALIPLWVLRARPAIAALHGPGALGSLRPRRLVLASGARTEFRNAAAVGFLSFALFGFCLSLAPRYFAEAAGIRSPLWAGVLAALVLIASAAVQLLGRPDTRHLPAALAAMAAGTLLVAVAGTLSNLPLLGAATLFAGMSQGTALRAAFNALSVAVPPADNARVVSAVYVVTYLGSAIPVLGLGSLAAAIGVPASVMWFFAVLAACCLLLSGLIRLQHHRNRHRTAGQG